MRSANDSLCSHGQHSSLLLRIIGAMTSLSLGLTSLAACAPTSRTPSESSTPTVSSLTTSEAKNIELGDHSEYSGITPLPTNSGPLNMYEAPHGQTTLIKHNIEGGMT